VRSSEHLRFAALLLAIAGPALTHAAHAQHLGVIGPVYPIAEPSLLAVIQSSLQGLAAGGGLERLQRESQARVRRQIEEPTPVAGLNRTATARTFHIDPSIEVPYPVTDAEGRLIVAPGTRVNPLDVVSLSRPLFFFDARDAEQVDRARRELTEHRGQVKLILTGGSYLDLMRRWKQTVYYDQQGLLTTRLGIRQVPARVTQDGRRLRVDELR
jgi:conjugal transfer pilus assembly protein TraW